MIMLQIHVLASDISSEDILTNETRDSWSLYQK